MSNKQKDSAYLTTRVVKSAASKGIRQASEKAIKTASSLVEVDGDWVVRRYQDGRLEKLHLLEKVSSKDIEQKVARLTRG